MGEAVGGLGGIGSIVGAVGNILQSVEQKRAAAAYRKSARAGVHAGEARTQQELSYILGSKEYVTAQNMIRGLYGMNPVTGRDIMAPINSIFGNAPQPYRVGSKGWQGLGVERATDPVMAGLKQSLTPRSYNEVMSANNQGLADEATATADMFAARGDVRTAQHYRTMAKSYTDEMRRYPTEAAQPNPFDTLTNDFLKGIRQAQSARGLYGSQAGAGAEASGLAAFRANLQIQMLPQLMGFATNPATMAQQLGGYNLNKSVFEALGGKGVYNQASPLASYNGSPAAAGISGAVSGFGAGASTGINLQTLLNQQQGGAYSYAGRSDSGMPVGVSGY